MPKLRMGGAWTPCPKYHGMVPRHKNVQHETYLLVLEMNYAGGRRDQHECPIMGYFILHRAKNTAMVKRGARVAQSPAEAKNFSSSLCVQTSSEAHPASYPTGTGGSFSLG
jgi:hypothetical protein